MEGPDSKARRRMTSTPTRPLHATTVRLLESFIEEFGCKWQRKVWRVITDDVDETKTNNATNESGDDDNMVTRRSDE